MTRKDYIAIAAAINRVYTNAKKDERYWIQGTIVAIGIALKEDNFRFDRTKFYCACTKEDKQNEKEI